MSTPLRVLLVEDVEDDALLALRQLQRGEFDPSYERVDTPESMEAALRKQAWDVVIADYSMPHFSGLAALEMLKTSRQDIPFILVSGTVGEQAAVEAMRVGASDYLMKTNLARLPEAVRRELGEADNRRARRQAEEQVRQKTQDLQLLNDINQAANQGASLREIATTISQRFREVYGLVSTVLYALSPDGTTLESVNQPLTEEVAVRIEQLLGRPLPATRFSLERTEVYSRIMRSDGPQLFQGSQQVRELIVDVAEGINPALRLAYKASIPAIQKVLGIRAVAAIPLRVEGRPIGLLEGSHKKEFSSEETRRLAYVAGMLTTVIKRKLDEEALQESEERYRALVEASPDAIGLLDPELKFTMVNAQGLRLLGYERAAEAAGQSLLDRLAPGSVRDVGAQMKRALREPVVDGMEADVVNKKGATIPVEVSTSVVKDAQGNPTGMVCVIRDITERKKAEQRTREEAARAQVLARVASLLNARLDLKKVLATVCEETIQALNIPFAAVYLHDDERQLLYPAALAGAPPEELRRLQPFGKAQYDEAAQTLGRTFVIPDVKVLPPEQARSLDPTGNARTLASVSMLRGEDLVGTLVVVTADRVRVFTEDELMLLQGVADQAAQAIVNARLYEQSRRRLGYSQALRNIDLAITAVLDLRLTLQILLQQATSQLGVDAADVLLLNRDSQVLEYAVGKGFDTGALRHTRLRVGEGHAGLAALERRIVNIPDLRASDAFRLSPTLPQEKFTAYFAVPLIAKGEVKGVLELFHRSPLRPDPEWLEFMEALGGQAAIAIDNATLFDSLQRTHVDLVLAYDSTIEGWSRALDLRDKETEGHTQRVAEMTLQLARATGMSEAEMVHVRRGALLHDIGKMGIPDTILLKPGPLTAEEWEVMRRHPVYAYELLWPIAYLRPAIDIPHCHHEKWDGSGYPRGLKGDQIPLAARLFAVVDVWDALRSERPYRPAWPEEKVLDHIRSGSGIHFEPRAVEAFVGIIRAAAKAKGTPGSDSSG